MPSNDEDIEDISPHIRIRIDPRKKKEWLEYADEHHHGNLTSLIRHSVDNTISDEWILESKHQDAGSDISKLEDGIDEITDRLSVMERKVDDLSLHSSEEPEQKLSRDDLIKLSNRCQDLLPRLQSPVQFPSVQQSLSIDIADIPDESLIEQESDMDTKAWARAKITGRAEDLADALDEPTHQVRQSLIWLEQSATGSNVESTVDEGERRWFVRDPDATPDFEFLESNERDGGSDDFIQRE